MFLLIGASAFAFVMRTTEFMVVRERIYEIAGFYRTLGFLNVQDAAYGNIIEGADMLGASPLVGFEDRRRGAEAVLHDMNNVQIGGRIGNGGHVLFGMENFHIPIAEREQFAYFYAIINQIRESNSVRGGHYIELRLTVDDVAVAFAEHAIPGQDLVVRYFIQNGDGTNPLANMQEGERYFMRGAFYWVSNYGRGIRHMPPSPGGMWDILYMHPLNDQGLLYVHVPYGEVDFSTPGLENVPYDIEQMRYNQSAVWLRTTADMSAMPMMQEEFGQVALVAGRFLNHEDHVYERPVTVIHHALAAYRGLSIGDTITVSIPKEQEIVNLHTVAYFERGTLAWRGFRDTFVMGSGILDFAILGNPQEFMIEGLELEIVGTYTKLPNGPEGIRAASYTSILLANYVYIPDSLLPDGFMPVDNFHGYENYLWNGWYSFMLEDTRNEAAFILEYRDALANLGIEMQIIPSGSANFWELAEPTLTSILVNAVMFWIVLLLVFGLTAFLYTNQRRRDFAILRALGGPAKLISGQILTPMLFLGIPAIIAGGLFGWFFAINEVQNTLEPMSAIAGIELSIEFPFIWLAIQLAAASAVMTVMVYGFAKLIARQSVLEMLQGGAAKAVTAGTTGQIAPQMPMGQGQAAAYHQANPALSSAAGKAPEKLTIFNKLVANTQFIFRHIMRAPVKSALTISVALFFILTLGVLRQSISNTERDLDHLYDNTVMSGELVQGSALAHSTGDAMESVIRRQTVDALMEQGLIQSYYAEAGHHRFFIISEHEDFNPLDGTYDGFWRHFWNYINHEHHNWYLRRTNALFAFNCLDTFLAEFGEHPYQQAVPGANIADIAELDGMNVATDPLDVDFALGFGWDDFVYHDATLQTPIPVILSADTLELRGLAVGDAAYIVHSTPRGAFNRPRDFIEARIVVIGQHNGGIDRFLGRNAVLLPMTAMEFMLEDDLRYITFRFDVNAELNRDFVSVRNDIEYLVDNHGQRGVMPLRANLNDQELRVAAGQMEQNLVLLQLLYPIAIALSLLIGSGLAILLMLQNAKIAAIMRVLGYGRLHTCTVMFFAHFFAAVGGPIVLLFVVPLLNINFVTQAQLALLAGIYLVGIVIGSAAGTVIITNRAPLGLLQVRE